MRFRRKEAETYNEQLLREAGLDQRQPADPYAGTYPAQQAFGAYTRAMARPEQWDVYLTVDAPSIGADAVEFAALPEGDLIIDDEEGDADLSPLADAIEQRLQPPYRAVGRRQDGALWAVAARQIEVRRMKHEGDELELVEGDSVTRGTRLDGDLWEIRTDRL